MIANRYRILRVLGSGGMAVVYEAEHQLTGRRCALKIIHSHLARRPELTSLFLKEAKIGSTTGRNPHIVDVFDADYDAARGTPFLAMDLLEGETVDLGGMYRNGTGVEKKDEKRAAELYQKACDGGEMTGCNNLADMYLKGKGFDRVDNKRAAELFQKACDGGEMMGCSNLGGMYLNGIGVDRRDENRAIELYKKACAMGNKDACIERQRLAPNSP